MLVSLKRVLLGSILKNVPYCPVPLRYSTAYPQKDWRDEYNHIRPRSTLDYRPPAPEVIIPLTLTQQVVVLMGAGQAHRGYHKKLAFSLSN